MNRVASVLRLIALSALVAGCAHPRAPDLYAEGRRPIRIDILNSNFNDASVWAVYRADRIRLGTVTGKTDATFHLPWNGTEPVQMEIDLVGGERCLTEALTVDEGDILYLEIGLVLSKMPECRAG